MEKFIEYLESRNWGVRKMDDGSYNIEWTTPYFGDFNMDLDAESPLSDFEYQAESFDVDEYVALWLGGPGAPNAKLLVSDAEAIEEELNEILSWLNN